MTEKGKRIDEIKVINAPGSKAAGKKVRKGGQKGRTPADDILKLTAELEPAAQADLHRFSLRLQSIVSLKAIAPLVIVILMLTLALIVQGLMSASNIKVFAIDAHGRMISPKLYDADEWQYSDAAVSEFVSDSMVEIFDFTFVNWQRRMEKAGNERFTAAGKQQFRQSIDPVLKDVNRLQGFVQAESAGPARVVSKSKDLTTWTVKKPIILTLTPRDGEPISNKRIMTVIINRVDDYESLKGIAINQLVVSDR